MNKQEIKSNLRNVFFAAEKKPYLDKIKYAAKSRGLEPEDFIELNFSGKQVPEAVDDSSSIISRVLVEDMCLKTLATEMLANGFTGQGMDEPEKAEKYIKKAAFMASQTFKELKFEPAESFWKGAVNHYYYWLNR